ncbi:MAG: hypothetical protein ABIH74_03530, partial [Candidatus Omnitrophota bacterium]
KMLSDSELTNVITSKGPTEQIIRRVIAAAWVLEQPVAARIIWSNDMLFRVLRGAVRKREGLKREKGAFVELFDGSREPEEKEEEVVKVPVKEGQISDVVRILAGDPRVTNDNLSLVEKGIITYAIRERCDAAFKEANIAGKVREENTTDNKKLSEILKKVRIARNKTFKSRLSKAGPVSRKAAGREEIDALIEQNGLALEQIIKRLVADKGITAADLEQAVKGIVTDNAWRHVNDRFKESKLVQRDLPDDTETNGVLIDILKGVKKRREKEDTAARSGIEPQLPGIEEPEDRKDTAVATAADEKLIDKIATSLVGDTANITVFDVERAKLGTITDSTRKVIGKVLREAGVLRDDDIQTDIKAGNEKTADWLYGQIVRAIGRKRQITPGLCGKLGRSPEDAMMVIAFSEDLQSGNFTINDFEDPQSGSFTINDFREAYNSARKEFDFAKHFADLPVRVNDTQSWRDLGELVRLGLLTVDNTRRENKYKLTARGYLKVALILLQGYNERKNALDLKELERMLTEMPEVKGEFVLSDGTSGLIFSEKTVFDNGLGVLLPKLARSGVPVAVIATTPEQQELIRTLNEDIIESDKRINCAESVAELVNSKIYGLKNLRRYYYLMVEGDVDPGLAGVTPVDITGLVEKIIENLGKVCGIPDQIGQLRRAARYFAIAA